MVNLFQQLILRLPSLFRRFLKAKALDVKHARTLADVGCKESRMFQRMVEKGVFVACDNGRYYLNEAGCDAFRATRVRRIVMAIVAVVAFVIVASFVK